MTEDEIPQSELLVDVEDGIAVGLYHYLWMKDGKGRACPNVNVPHTVIFTDGKPTVWYFTSGKDKSLKRKHRSNITHAAINEAFVPKALAALDATEGGGQRAGDGSAWMVHGGGATDALGGTGGGAEGRAVEPGTSTGTQLGPWRHHGVVARFQGAMTMPHGANSPRKRKNGSSSTELQESKTEWFSREQLRELLPPGHHAVHGVAALHEGVLQRFVQPRGHCFFTLRATWSPNACVVERRINKTRLNDPRSPLTERLTTWDGPSWLSDHTPIHGSTLHAAVCSAADSVAAHLADVSGGSIRVLRMVLYFQIDEQNRLWMTHCGTLKTMPPKDGGVRGGHHLPGAHGYGRPARPFAPPQPGALGLRMPDSMAHGAHSPMPGAGEGAARAASPAVGGGPVPYSSRAAALNVALLGGPLDLSRGPLSLDLPAPAASFSATKAQADAEAATNNARFLCVLTGEMYPGSDRVEVTYKQLLQHWFSQASQLPNEGDRLRAMDTIPLAIRRANASLSRELYLRVRSQPNFLYRTAPVCSEAAAALNAATGGGDGEHGSGQRGTGALGRPVTRGGLESSPTTGLRRGGAAQRGAASARQRPATALVGSAGPHSGPAGVSSNAHAPLPVAMQPRAASSRPAARSKSSGNSPAGGGRTAPIPAGGLVMSGYLASRYGAVGRQPSAAAAAGSGHGGGSSSHTFPSMLMPRGPNAYGGQGGAGGSPLHELYGPSGVQVVTAHANTAALAFDAIDDATAMTAVKEAHLTRAEEVMEAQAAAAASVAHAGMPSFSSGMGFGPGVAGAGASGGAGGGHANGRSGSGDLGGGSPVVFPITKGSGASSRRTRSSHQAMRLHRMSTSSEATELGSEASGSDLGSPSGGSPSGGGAGTVGGSGGGYGTSGGSARMSPPRSAAPITLQTIHEEGGVAAAGAPRGTGSHSVPRMRPPTREGRDKPSSAGAAGGGSSSARYYGSVYSSGSGAAMLGYRGANHMSESGDIPALLPGGGSLNASMASSFGSMASRRSNGVMGLSNDDMRTLRELNEAYSAAEQLTQSLLAQAQDILSEDGAGSRSPSRPASTATSPARTYPHAAAPASPGSSINSRPVSRGEPKSSISGAVGGGARVPSTSRSGLPPTAPGPRPGSSGVGPSPLGQTASSVSRSGGGPQRGSSSNGATTSGGGSANGSNAASASASRQASLKRVSSSGRQGADGSAEAEQGIDKGGAEGLSLPPVAPAPPSRPLSRAGSTGGSPSTGRQSGSGGAVEGSTPVLPPAAGAAAAEAVEADAQPAAPAPVEASGGSGAGSGPTEMLTPAEADLLAEALRDE